MYISIQSNLRFQIILIRVGSRGPKAQKGHLRFEKQRPSKGQDTEME